MTGPGLCRSAWRALLMLLWVGLAIGLPAGHAVAQVPCLPPLTCESPSPSPSPSPAPSTAEPDPTTAEPDPTTDPGTVTPEPGSTGGAGFFGGLLPTAAPVPSGSSPDGAPVPDVASPAGTSPAARRVSSVAAIDVSGAFAIVLGGLLVTPLVLVFLAGLIRPAYAPAAGGTPMSSSRRWRLLLGAGCLVLAGVVGTIGWYKISGEPLLNFQVPLLASTGMAVTILAVTGGALLVAEQMRTDDRRLDDLEAAVRQLAESLAPQIEQPPRIASADVEPEEAPRRARRSRTTS